MAECLEAAKTLTTNTRTFISLFKTFINCWSGLQSVAAVTLGPQALKGTRFLSDSKASDMGEGGQLLHHMSPVLPGMQRVSSSAILSLTCWLNTSSHSLLLPGLTSSFNLYPPPLDHGPHPFPLPPQVWLFSMGP